MSVSLVKPGRCTFQDWFAAATAHGAQRLPDLSAYMDTAIVLAGPLRLNHDAVLAQSAHETGWWTSRWWVERLNPAGLGITGDPAQNEDSHTFPDGKEAAWGHLAHLYLYAHGTEFPEGLSWLRGYDPRWDAAFDAGFAGIAKMLDDLSGRWAADLDYHVKIERIYDAMRERAR